MKVATIIFLASTALFAVQAVRFDVKNLEIGAIWVGVKEKPGKAAIEEGGFQLGAGQGRSITVPDDWAGKLWPRTWCGWPKANECLTGDCDQRLQCGGNDGKPPYSSIEIELKGDGGYDKYFVTLASGYNIGVAVEPINGVRNSTHHFSCSKAACVFNFQLNCPGPLLVRHEHNKVACHSPCVAFSADEHCCHKRSENMPEVCRSLEWRDIQPGHFKKFCPDALTYVHDKKNIFTCKADAYRINFGGAW